MNNHYLPKYAGQNTISAARHNTGRFAAIILLTLCLFTGSAWGQMIPFAENFAYTTGNLLGQGGGWTLQGTDNTNPIQVTSPGLYYPQYQSSGIGFAATVARNTAGGQDLFSNFTGTNSISSGSVYISALVKVTSATRGGDYFLSFKETTGSTLTVFKGRLYAKDSLGTGNLVFGVTKSASGPTAPIKWCPTYFTFGTTYLAVLKYTFYTGTVNDSVSMYIFDPANPFPVTEPATPNAITADAGSDGTGQRCVQLRQGTVNSPVVIVDGIRAGIAWADAVTQDLLPPVATFDPGNGAINIVPSAIPTITFNEPVRKTDGSPILNADLASLITFKKTNASGPNVSFTATIDGTGKIITITPSAPLDYSQVYYLSVAPVQDGAGNNSATQASTFTTIANTISNDATLSDLQVDGTTVAGFSPAILNYNVSVPYGATVVPTVTATQNYPLATLLITPAASLPGTTNIHVTAQDGITQLTYTITFTHAPPSTNSALTYIKWLPNGFDPVKQNIRVKDFSSTTLDYSVEIPIETSSLIVDAEPEFVIPAAGCPPATYVVTQPVNLTGTVAERTANIVCTAQDGITTTTYHVLFTKESSSTVYLFKEGFDIMPPAGWTNTANVGTSATNGMGFYGSTTAYATPKFKWSSPNDGGILETPANNGANVLKFIVKVLDKNVASNLHFFVEKSNNNADWSLVSQDPMPLYVSISQWHQVILTINDLNPSVYIRFRATASTGDNSTGLFYLDDVSLSANSIPNTTEVTGTVGNLQTQCYNALQTITVAGNSNTFIVQNGGQATMIAGQNILYEPGTKVESGGLMVGKIAPDGPFCNVKSASIANVSASQEEIPVNSEKTFFKVYPNPTSGEFTLEFTNGTPVENTLVEIYNMQGQKVLTTSVSGERKHVFSLDGNKAGCYLFRMISNDRAELTKIIKQ